MTGVARLTSKSSLNGGRRSRPVAGAQCALEFISAWPRKQSERDFVARKWELNLLATMAKTKRWGNQLGIGLLAMLTHHYRFVLPAGSGAKVRPAVQNCNLDTAELARWCRSVPFRAIVVLRSGASSSRKTCGRGGLGTAGSKPRPMSELQQTDPKAQQVAPACSGGSSRCRTCGRGARATGGCGCSELTFV